MTTKPVKNVARTSGAFRFLFLIAKKCRSDLTRCEESLVNSASIHIESSQMDCG